MTGGFAMRHVVLISAVLGLAFSATLNAPIPERAKFGVFRM